MAGFSSFVARQVNKVPGAKRAVAQGAQWGGNIEQALGGDPSKARQFSSNLRDPNVNYAGRPNPTGPPTVNLPAYRDTLDFVELPTIQQNGGGGGGSGGAGGGGAASAVNRRAQAGALKAPIQNLITGIMGVYDQIYGDVNAAAGEKAGKINQQYDTETRGLTEQFNSAFPAIGNAYGARGTYDSSYRQDAETTARNQFNTGIEQLGQGRANDLAGVGSFVAQQRADVEAQKGGLAALLQNVLASENPDELTQVRNELDARIREVQGRRAGMQTQGSYLNTLNSVVPSSSRLAGLQQNLTNVINAQIPQAIKRDIGARLINNSGLSQEEIQGALGNFNAEIDKEKVVA